MKRRQQSLPSFWLADFRYAVKGAAPASGRRALMREIFRRKMRIHQNIPMRNRHNLFGANPWKFISQPANEKILLPDR
jgi:hypothetical protein